MLKYISNIDVKMWIYLNIHENSGLYQKNDTLVMGQVYQIHISREKKTFNALFVDLPLFVL